MVGACRPPLIRLSLNSMTSFRRYKPRAGGMPVKRFELDLAAVLWRFVEAHEGCLARSAGAAGSFDLVTTVPSGESPRDDAHPLRRIVGSVVAPTRDRHERLLRRSGTDVPQHTFDPGKYNATRDLAGASVLLIDDTWTTGASAQSAARALEIADAGQIGILVIGRHVDPDFNMGENRKRPRALPVLFDWDVCARH